MTTTATETKAETKTIKTFTVNTPITITSSDIDNIMTSALEGGSNYWYRSVEAVDRAGAEYLSETLGAGGSLKLYVDGGDVGDCVVFDQDLQKNVPTYGEDEDGTYFLLTAERIAHGVGIYATTGRLRVDEPYEVAKKTPLTSGEVYTLDIDGDSADTILQYACFGEVVYG
jgi:hypothetical protein